MSEELPDQTNDELRAQAQAVNTLANDPSSSLRGHLDIRCGNSSAPFDRTGFIQSYREHLPAFMSLRAKAMALAAKSAS